ncbi:MAG: spermidine synthase [Gemmatimonadales bacterium]
MTPLLIAVFIFSGAAGLIYESIWSRYLSLFVGHSAYAQVIVLVIYLGGMSLGAALVARRSERIREPLVGYAGVEIAVGLIGLFFHEIFRGVSGFAYTTIFPALAGGATLVIVKWLLAGLLILPQSILLGTTFPLMSAGLLRLVSRDGATDSGRTLSVLYFANSIGAAAGVLVAGFYLIALVGLPGTLVTAAIINLLVGLTVFGAVRLTAESPAAEGPALEAVSLETGVEQPPTPVSRLPTLDPGPATLGSAHAPPTLGSSELPMLWRVMLIVSAGTALSSFIYEISWVRMLSLVLGSATHSFELMLSAFIFGLAVGALWVRTRADRFYDPIRALGVTQWAMGALAILTLFAYLASFHWMASLITGLDQNEDGYRFFTIAKYGIALAVMLPATFCAGVTLPLITRTLLGAGSGERAIGAVYSVNTLGSIVGAGLAALLLLPWLGLKTLLITGGVIDMVLGVWLLFIAGRSSAQTRRFAIGVAGATILVVFSASMNIQFDRGILISGVFRYGRVPAAGSRSIVFYRDGRTATVSVRKAEDGGYSLATNGKPDASLSPIWFEPVTDSMTVRRLDGDESTQVLLPMITLAHAPLAKQGAVIGNGSGMSSHLLLGSPHLESLVTIDIEPEMINGSHTFYPINRRVFDDPRAHYVHDDAKSYFAAANRKFDLILSEPSNPWVSGVSGLFTDEFYQRIHGYLSEDGVFGQWLHLYEIDDGLVLGVIKAVRKNFASYDIYLTADVDVLIVASNKPQLPAPDWSVFALPEVAKDLAHFRAIGGDAVEASHLVSSAVLEPLVGDGKGANSDFYPTLDLETERSRFMKEYARGFSGLNDSRWDLGAALLGRRILPNKATDPVLDIGRVNALAMGARLRGGERPDPGDVGGDRDFREAASRAQTLRDVMASGHPPADWLTFFKLAAEVENDRHAGTMGWADEAWYAEVSRFVDQQRAPFACRAALRFLHGIAAYNWPLAAAQVDSLLRAREDGTAWLNNDLFRDGAVVALLRTGDVTKARSVFDNMADYAVRKPGDLRVRMLDAHLAQAEEQKRGSGKP